MASAPDVLPPFVAGMPEWADLFAAMEATAGLYESKSPSALDTYPWTKEYCCSSSDTSMMFTHISTTCSLVVQ